MRARMLALLAALAACACGGQEEASTGEQGELGSEGSTDTETETGGAEPTCANPPALPSTRPPPVEWLELGELTVDDGGLSSSLSLPLSADARYLALRTTPVDGEAADNAQLCHALASLQLGDQTPLIPSEGEPFLDTDQRSYPGPSAGVFVFSSALAPLAGPDTLELQIQLRNCVTDTNASRAFFPGMPTRLRVEVASEPLPAPESPARVGVRLLIAEDSGWGLVGEDEGLTAAWEVAVERFAAVGVELELEAQGLSEAVGELRHAGDMLPMRPLHERALACLRADDDDQRFIPVVLVPCLRSEQLGNQVSTDLGRTTRLPGSLADTSNPSLVLLSSAQCNFDGEPALASARYGVILAHELGHYLGLHHSDAEIGAHLEHGSEELLMRSDIGTMVEASAAWFSEAQATVLRRHPVVVFD